MKIIGNFKDLLQDSTGKGIVSFLVSNFSHKTQLSTLEKDKTYSIEIKEVKSKRSIEQNRYMWALLHEIDVAMNGERFKRMKLCVYSVWSEQGQSLTISVVCPKQNRH